MNKIIMMGRLTKDPETKNTQSGITVTTFNIAVNKRFKKEGGADADFFQWTAFGRTADFVSRYVRKGTQILVEGRIENNNYTTKEGEKRYRDQMIVDNVEFADSKKATTEEDKEDDGFVELPQEELYGLPFMKSNE